MNLDTAQIWECLRCGSQRKYGTTENPDVGGGELYEHRLFPGTEVPMHKVRLLGCKARCTEDAFSPHGYVDTVAEVPAYGSRRELAVAAGVH